MLEIKLSFIEMNLRWIRLLMRVMYRTAAVERGFEWRTALCSTVRL